MTKVTSFRQKNKRLIAAGWKRLVRLENPLKRIQVLIEQHQLLTAGMPNGNFSNPPIHISNPIRQLKLNLMTGSNSEREEKLLSMLADRDRLEELRAIKPDSEEAAEAVRCERLNTLVRLLSSLLDYTSIASRK